MRPLPRPGQADRVCRSADRAARQGPWLHRTRLHRPGYLCEVHHVEEWATGGATDIDKLTFACTGHHKLLDHGWTTKKLANGDTQWIPPPQLPLPLGTNTYHHPEKLLS